MSVPALSIDRCSKIYNQGSSDSFKAVSDVSFSIAQGDFTVLLGLNGAGKTSLIRMITGLSTITQGEIRIFGKDLVRDTFEAKKLLGVMPQEVNFNPFLSIMDTLVFYGGYYGLSRDFIEHHAEPLLKKARLWDKRDTLVSGLSGGMKRMVMLIRTLVTQPKLVILDEPTANLDMEIREIIWRLLRSLHSNGVTVLLTTHNLVEAQALCDNIVIIHHGNLVLNNKIKDAITELDEHFFTISLDGHSDGLTQLDMRHAKLLDGHKLMVRITRENKLADYLAQLARLGINYHSIAPSNNQLEQILKKAIV